LRHICDEKNQGGATIVSSFGKTGGKCGPAIVRDSSKERRRQGNMQKSTAGMGFLGGVDLGHFIEIRELENAVLSVRRGGTTSRRGKESKKKKGENVKDGR